MTEKLIAIGEEAQVAKPLFGLDRAALRALVSGWGVSGWRAGQLAQAMYQQRIEGISEITTLGLALRQKIEAEGYVVGRPRIQQVFSSTDGTERYLMECADGRTVETVWMPEGDEASDADEEDADSADDLATSNQNQEKSSQKTQRATICVSSQVGCAVDCQFCLTARLGFERNLTAGEIAGQVLAVLARHRVEVGRDRVNLVFMGMGEPFLNYANFMAAVRLLVEEAGLSPRRMTVSTSGIVTGIEQFAAEPLELRPHLALSLNAPNDRVRGEVMPINRKWPIETLIAALQRIPLRPKERITFEYVLLGGVTDRAEDARELARLVRRTGLSAKVNLIAWNAGPGISFASPEPRSVEKFKQSLVQQGVSAYLRRPRGRDIYAACGQLKRTVEG
jgi:23S rRNA (adenine2503-C2)-methyltransferase